MELIDVVMKLVGPVDPVGETHTDDKRLDNLIVLRDLTRDLLDRIESVAEASGGHMASVKVAKDCAASFLADVRGVAPNGLQTKVPHTPPIPEEPQSPTTTGGEKPLPGIKALIQLFRENEIPMSDRNSFLWTCIEDALDPGQD